MIDETRTRFLAGIAAQLPADRIAEVHLFAAIRQGGVESGVAVIAVQLPVDDASSELPSPVEARADTEVVDEPALDGPPRLDGPALDGPTVGDITPTRYTVYTARFRHTLKGPERGKWELAVTEEADAPLLTVDAVVRGVSRRSGEADETVRLSGDEFRAALPEPARA